MLQLLRERGLTLGLAESLTGGLIASRITSVPGCSDVFRGCIVPYDREVKIDVLGAPDVPVVSEEMAAAMAEGACRTLGTDVGIAVTGVAGPDPHDGHEPGHVWVAVHLDGRTDTNFLNMPFDRERIRQFTCIMSLNMLRRRLIGVA